MTTVVQPPPRTAFLVGEGSLARLVAAAWRARGHALLGFASDDETLATAMAKAEVPRFPSVDEARLAALPPLDFLLSVVNPRLLDTAAIGWPQQLAINYHDAPLPRHAGVNAAAWAILEGDREHGVTWHAIDAGIDTGPILIQRRFPIPDGATAEDLHLLCFRHAGETFHELLDAIERGTLQRRPQTVDGRSVHRVRDRLPEAGLLDFAQPAAPILRELAAAYHGRADNDFGCAKVLDAKGTAWRVLRGSAGRPVAPGEQPGTVVAARSDVIEVAAKDLVVVLTGLSPIAPDPGRTPTLPRIGESFAPWTRERRDALHRRDREAAGHERFWRARLAGLRPALLPGLAPGRLYELSADDDVLFLPLPQVAPGERLAWFGRALLAWTGRDCLDFGWLDEATAEPGLFATVKPVRFHRDDDDAGLLAQGQRPSFPLDIFARFPSLASAELPWRSLRVVLGRQDRPSSETDVPLLVTPDEEAGGLRLRLAGSRRVPGFGPALLAALRQRAEGNAPLPPTTPSALASRLAEALHRRPDAVVIEHGDVTLTYAALAAQSAALAGRLADAGVGPGATVGLLLPRSIPYVVALTAVLRAGAAFVPIDPEAPDAVVRGMLRDAGAVAIVTGPTGAPASLPGLPAPLIPVTPALVATVTPTGTMPALPGAFAYVLYTSGSTGRPKGTLVGVDGLVHFLDADASSLALGAQDRVLQLCSLAFDASIEEILGAILAGATLVLRPEELLDSPGQFVAFCAAQRLTVIGIFPALLGDLVAHLERTGPLAPSVRLATTGGEAVPPPAVRRWQGVFAAAGRPVPRLVNVYGLTETTVANVHGDLTRDAGDDVGDAVPLGRPLPGNRIDIRDDAGQPLPVGARGEIWIGGVQVALGYLNLPALGAERFVVDADGATWCRTGDLGHVDANGRLHFRGRRDDQLKRGGVRIEPGELEAVLRSHPAVGQVGVAIRELAPGDRRLVAWVAPDSPGLRESLEALFEQRLPRALHPAELRLLAALPVNDRGKVDTAYLLATAGRPDPATVVAVLAAPDAEKIPTWLVEAWTECFPTAGPTRLREGFFYLGGDSLLALGLLSTIERRTGSPIPLSALYADPTLAGLARAAKSSAAATPVIVHRDRGSLPPVVFVYTVGGDVNESFGLAEALGAEVPALAIRCPALGDPARWPRSMEEAAAGVDALLEQRSLPPRWTIAGYSWGGLLAHAVAARRAARGVSVPDVLLLDSLPALPAHGPLRRTAHCLRHGPAWMLNMVWQGRASARLRGRQTPLVPEGDEPSWMNDPLTQHLLVLGDAYRPSPTPGLRLHLFRSQGRPLAHPLQPAHPGHLADNGWYRFAGVRPTVWNGTAGHHRFLKPPHLAKVAAAVLDVLRRMSN